MYKTTLNISDVIRLSFRCWLREPVAFALIALVAMLPHSLFGIFLQLDPTQVLRDTVSDVTLIAWEFTEIAAWSAVKVGIVFAVLQALKNGEPDIRNSVNWGAPFMFLAIGIDTLVYLPWILLYILWDSQQLVPFAIVVGLWLCAAVIASVAIPALVVERGGFWRSLRRSYDLTRGSRWRIFAIFLCIELSSRALKLVLDVVSGYLPADTLSGFWNEALHLVDHAFFAMVSAIVSVVLYQELRLLKGESDSDRIVSVFE
jgi:hypothetical protein